MSALINLSIASAALGTGLMAGVYFTFSTFVMKALEMRPSSEAIEAMRSINKVILSSAFMPVFFSTTILAAAMVALGVHQWGHPRTWSLVTGGLLYVLGMFATTVFANVPLNDALHDLSATAPEADSFWKHYLSRWTFWNHLRTLASTLACGLFLVALVNGP